MTLVAKNYLRAKTVSAAPRPTPTKVDVRETAPARGI